MGKLKSFWQQVNAEPVKSDGATPVPGAIWRSFRDFFLKPHLGSIIIIILLAGSVGVFSNFIYAWSGRFIADDIIQIQMKSKDIPEATTLEPTSINENRHFALNTSQNRGSWSQRHLQTSGNSTARQIQLLGYLGIILVTMVVLEHIAAQMLHTRMAAVGIKVRYTLRHRIYKKLHQLQMQFHDETSVGSQMTHLFSDINTLQQATAHLIWGITRNGMMMIIGLAILFTIDVNLSLLVLTALPAYAWCYSWFHRRLKVVHENLRHREGRLNGHMINRIKNFYLVKSFVREQAEALSFLRKARPILNDTVVASILGICFTVVCGIISGMCMVAVLWLGALRVRNGEMTLGALLLFYGSAGLMFSPIASISGIITLLHRLRVASGKILHVLDEPVKLDDPKDNKPVPKATPELRFENVSMHYNKDAEPVIENLTFTIPSGKTLCVMGPSGSGKSTVAMLGCRLYDVSSGSIKLDETDIRDFRLSHLRSMTGFLSQEPVIFNGSIRDNIKYGADRVDGEDGKKIVAAAQDAQIHDYIWELPEKYLTATRQRGLTLSGGQKQRVGLARVLLYNPSLLILDDCTSALDAETEAKLIAGFDTSLKGRTVLLVSHRISVAMNCDLVLILKDGKKAEFGSPKELLKQKGFFAKLREEQLRETESTSSQYVPAQPVPQTNMEVIA
jgi:ABC-type multidrug transport system fused ATPase/permease subunit